jgi:hypothetical protein
MHSARIKMNCYKSHLSITYFLLTLRQRCKGRYSSEIICIHKHEAKSYKFPQLSLLSNCPKIHVRKGYFSCQMDRRQSLYRPNLQQSTGSIIWPECHHYTPHIPILPLLFYFMPSTLKDQYRPSRFLGQFGHVRTATCLQA